MTIRTNPAATVQTTRKEPLLLRALNWLAERDRRYREAHKLRGLPRERLEDMGMTRADAESAFDGGPRAQRPAAPGRRALDPAE